MLGPRLRGGGPPYVSLNQRGRPLREPFNLPVPLGSIADDGCEQYDGNGTDPVLSRCRGAGHNNPYKLLFLTQELLLSQAALTCLIAVSDIERFDPLDQAGGSIWTNGDCEDVIDTRNRDGNGQVSQDFGLTSREHDVLKLLGEGWTDKEIAIGLGVSKFTINKHVRAILTKVGAASRTEAAVRAFKVGLID